MPAMEEYNVVLTRIAKRQIIGCYLYIVYEFKDPLAADSFLEDVNNTIDLLKFMPTGLPLCEDDNLKKEGYRIIHLKRHRYKLLYRIKKNRVVIDAIYHNLQKIKNSEGLF